MGEVQVVETNYMPQVKEWNGQRVVTFKDIDVVHGRKSGTARRNFNSNKKYFIENVDYVIVTHDNPIVRNSYIGNTKVPPRGLTLITETGYLMIVKSFTDDLSWEVQRNLVNNYFKPRVITQQLPQSDNSVIYDIKELGRPKSWYERTKWKFDKITSFYGWSYKFLYHVLLSELSRQWDMERITEIYTRKYGYAPKYKMNLVNEIPFLQGTLDRYIQYLLDEIQSKEETL